eukprot:768156-Hanusia_phi.AAC.11
MNAGDNVKADEGERQDECLFVRACMRFCGLKERNTISENIYPEVRGEGKSIFAISMSSSWAGQRKLFRSKEGRDWQGGLNEGNV